MTIQECYEAMGGDYNDVVSRLRTEDRIARFLVRILDDQSMNLLVNSIADRNLSEAFRAAHTLKGVCLNLSLVRLGGCVSDITEALRNREEYGEDLEPLLAAVREEYDNSMKCITAFKEEHMI